ncbi:MAG: type VI secretion system tip protein VgrG [Xanthomonadaceae bacterium]|nr:type VI secretion system tip protein VgrG [Xanthomonadaceae bacterium]
MFFLTPESYGEDDLLIEEMSGQEGVSRLFEFRLKLLSEREDIEPEDIIGKRAILRTETFDTHHSGGERFWNGFVSRFSITGTLPASSPQDDTLYCYECDIVPWFWFMTQNEDCRIFQNKSVPDIIETLFEEFGYDDYKLELSAQYPLLDYCTQYNETTFNFISRLIEREGIYYYFRHDESSEARHILVFTDNLHDNPRLDPFHIPFHQSGKAKKSDAITKLLCDRQTRTRKTTLSDWDYQFRRVMNENTPSVLDIGTHLNTERYRYYGGFDAQSNSPDGKDLARVQMESDEASHLTYSGESQARGLTPGHVFELEDHPRDAFNSEYMVLSVQHRGNNNLLGNFDGAKYRNTFSLHPKALPNGQKFVYRPPQITPHGLVRGPQTATVVGASGNEVYTDETGRIKVRFHWDRKVTGRRTNTQDDKASCWVRVAQLWAGNGYGTMFTPRVGMEVVVDFLEGNPDRPLVTGCVYNGPNAPPLDFPAGATRSTIKTLSSKGGGGFNELRFEDKKGDEEIFLHAEKDLQLRTGNNRTENIGADTNLTIGKNRIESIAENADLTVGKSQTVTVGQNRAVDIATESYLTVGTNHHVNAGTNMALTAGANIDQSAGANAALSAGANIDIKAGMNLVLEAGAMLSLKAGGNFIVFSPAGIMINGTMVMINSGGSGLSAMKARKAEKADKAKKAVEAIKNTAGKVNDPVQQLQAKALKNACREVQPFCAECEAARLQLEALESEGIGYSDPS